MPLRLGAVAHALGHRLAPPLVTPADDLTASIVWELRLPRVLLAALVGAALALAGVAMQGLLGNPLADPYTVGVSSGASLGAGLAIFLGITGLWGGMAVSLCAFAAALLTMLVVFALARTGGRLHTASFLLAGIIAGSFLWALVTLLLVLAHKDQRTILLWLMGGFGDADWRKVALMAPFTLLGAVVFAAAGRGLDAFSFGEETARSVGVEVERFKMGILALSALVTAASVSAAGIIGFVGLVVPHVARRLVGPPHRPLAGVAALVGAILLIWADLLARTIHQGEEFPVGVITALIGAPFFCWLLRRQTGK